MSPVSSTVSGSRHDAPVELLDSFPLDPSGEVELSLPLEDSAGFVLAVGARVHSVVESFADAVELELLLDSSAFVVLSSPAGQPTRPSTIIIEIKRLSSMARTIAGARRRGDCNR